jgi:branched-chain amino acid transport system ATP-binding protein
MLEIEGLAVSYGLVQALFGLDLNVREGQVVCVLGRNGAGKSTTLKAIMGLLRPTAGSIRLMGREIAGLPPYKINALGVGYVPEDRRLFSGLTVGENLAVGRRDGGIWSMDVVLSVFPALEPFLERKAGTLSGGEQQMLAMARTLIGGPRLLLLDEPSSGLAPLVLRQLIGQIQGLSARGVTTLLSEQNFRFAAEIANRVVVLDRGQVVYEGSFKDLEDKEGIRNRYLAV